MIFSVFVAMPPQAKQRPRHMRSGRAFTPKETVRAEAELRQRVQVTWGNREPLDEPLKVTVIVTMNRPKSTPKRVLWPTGRPDGDNLMKLTQDSLNGILWRDDSIIVDARVIKVYGATPGYTIFVEKAELVSMELSA